MQSAGPFYGPQGTGELLDHRNSGVEDQIDSLGDV